MNRVLNVAHMNTSGQIIAISHGSRFPPKGSVLEGESPAISGKSMLVKYYKLIQFGQIREILDGHSAEQTL